MSALSHPLPQTPCQFPGKRKNTPPPWHPSSLGRSPDPEATEQKKTMWKPSPWENSHGVYNFLGKTREKGRHHKSGKGMHHRGPRPEKKRVSTVVVYVFLPSGNRKRWEADTEFQYRPHIFDTDTIAIMRTPFLRAPFPRLLFLVDVRMVARNVLVSFSVFSGSPGLIGQRAPNPQPNLQSPV